MSPPHLHEPAVDELGAGHELRFVAREIARAPGDVVGLADVPEWMQRIQG